MWNYVLLVTLVLTGTLGLNKTKRTTSEGNFPEKAVLYYDNTGSPTGLATFYTKIKPEFQSEIPKLAAQQVLYEFQQTPTNAVSNVHVNQFYQPNYSPDNQTLLAKPLNSAESVANPIQYSSVIRHGQNYPQIHFPPTQTVPGKYLYANGKIVYKPNTLTFPSGFQPTQTYNHYNPNLYQSQPSLHQSLLNSYQNPASYHNPSPANYQAAQPLLKPGIRRQEIKTYSPKPPIEKFVPSSKEQIEKLTKSTPVYEPEEAEEDEDGKAPIKESGENEEEEVEEKQKYREEEEDSPKYHDKDGEDEEHFGRYYFDEDESDRYKEEEDEDEDRDRRSSKYVPKRTKKNTKKNTFQKYNRSKFDENYRNSEKFEKTTKRSPKKTKKYVKNSKPRVAKVEAKQSENVPVHHKQKVYRKKWLLSKSSDDSIK